MVLCEIFFCANYKGMTTNMKYKRLPGIVSNSNQSHIWLKNGWHKDVMSRLNHGRIKGGITLHDINAIKNTIIFKFKKKLWWDKEMKDR